MHGETVKLVGF